MTLAAPTPATRSQHSRAGRMRRPVLAATGVVAAAVALHLRDPHVRYSWGVCPLYALTGLYCPACGCLRGVNDLGDGHLGQAASSNLLLVLAVPFAVVLYARWATASWTGRDVQPLPVLPPWVRTAVLLVVAAFTVARNVPGSWLAP